MVVGKTRIVILAVRVLEIINSVRSKLFFKVTSRFWRISLIAIVSQVNPFNKLTINC